MMYKVKPQTKSQLKINKSYPAETIEAKVRRVLNNKEPITDTAPLIYTDRKDGVRPEFDIRTDRFEIALHNMDAAAKSHIAKREERLKLGEEAKKGMAKEAKSEQSPANTSDNNK